jgi:hypothetical protein
LLDVVGDLVTTDRIAIGLTDDVSIAGYYSAVFDLIANGNAAFGVCIHVNSFLSRRI